MSFAEKGAVADIDPAFFVGYLHRLKATGTLKFEDPPIQRAVYLREGRVLFSSSNAPEDQLGAILVAGGKISQQQFDDVVLGLEPKQSIAAALAQGGHCSQKDIGDAARRKVDQIVGACCAQTTGRYQFEDGVLPKGALDLKLTTEKVLVNAFAGLEPSGFLSRILKSPMAVLAQADVEPTDPDLVRLREALDGISSLADVGGKVGLPLAETEVRAAVLVVLGAASVVTSQIEEMALPDTRETYELAPNMTETVGSVGFDAEPIAFMPSPSPVDSGLGSEATLIMSPGDNPFAASSDASLVSASSIGLPSPRNPSDSGLSRSGLPKSEKATALDLDAVKALIGSPAPTPVRKGSTSLPSQQWEPVLSAESRQGRDRRGRAAVLQNPLVRWGAAIVILAGAGLVGWIAYTPSQTPRPPTTKSVGSSPAPTPRSLGGAALGQPSTSAPFTTPPSATTAPSAPASAPATPASAPATPASVSPRPTPLPMVAAKPIPSVAPGVVPTQTPVAPVAAKVTPFARPSPGSGQGALKAGRLDEAAADFQRVAESRSGEFSVQILVACSPRTIEKALQNDPSPDLFILPTRFGGKACHRLLRGFFKTNAEAAQSVATLPAYYVAEGAKPKVVGVKAVLN